MTTRALGGRWLVTGGRAGALREIEADLDRAEAKASPGARLWEHEWAAGSLRAALVVLARLRTGGAGDAEIDRLSARAASLQGRLRTGDADQLEPVIARIRAGDYSSDDLRRDLAARPPYERDAFVERLLGIAEHPAAEQARGEEMIKYQATPVAAILELIAGLGPEDVLYDLGSGLGKVAILAAWLSPARVRGVEYEPSYHRRAAERAAELRLPRLELINADARSLDYADGTVFYFFHPFEGSIMDDVLGKLSRIAGTRPITIAALGRSILRFDAEPWLRRSLDGGAGLVRYQGRAALTGLSGSRAGEAGPTRGDGDPSPSGLSGSRAGKAGPTRGDGDPSPSGPGDGAP